MIFSVEKIHAIEFQQLVMVALGDFKIHHITLWIFLGETYSNIDFGLPLWMFILDGPRLW